MRKIIKICYKNRIILLLLVLNVLFIGCLSSENDDKSVDRMFVEGSISIKNPIVSDFLQRPIMYGLLIEEQYDLEFFAQKYMSNLDGEMRLEIILPEGIKKIDGDLEWTGNDQYKMIEIVIQPLIAGNFLIRGYAVNYDNNFSTTNIVAVHVGETIQEAKNITNGNNLIIPIKTIDNEKK